MSRVVVLCMLLFAARSARAENPPPEDSIYGNLYVGVGGPLGGSTLPFSFSQDAGFGLVVGWAFRWGLGAELFGHYNDVSLDLPSELDGIGPTDGRLGLAGGAIRGTIGRGPVAAWASLGLAFGGGTADLEIHEDDDPIVYEVDFGPTPALAFGADFRIAPNIRLGPVVRGFLFGISRACEVQPVGVGFFGDAEPPSEEPVGGGGGKYGYGYGYYYDEPPPEPPPSRRVCVHEKGRSAIPGMLFVGLSLSYEVN